MKKINGKNIRPNGVRVGDSVELLEDFETQDHSLFFKSGQRGVVVKKERLVFRVRMKGGPIVVYKLKVRKVLV